MPCNPLRRIDTAASDEELTEVVGIRVWANKQGLVILHQQANRMDNSDSEGQRHHEVDSVWPHWEDKHKKKSSDSQRPSLGFYQEDHI